MGELISAGVYVMRMAWRTGPRALVLTFGEAVSTILRFVQPLTVGLVIGGLATHALGSVIWGTALLVASLGLGGALEALAVGQRVRLIEDVGFAFDRELVRSLAQIGRLDRLEEPRLAGAIAKARDRADMMGYCFNGLMSVLFQALAPITSICVAVVVDPRLLVLTLGGLPTILVARRSAGLHDAADEVAQAEGSLAAAWAALLSDPNAGAERKVFKLWDWYRRSISTAVGKRETAYLEAVAKDTVASFLAEVFHLVCTAAVLAWIFTTSDSSPGTVVAALLVSLDLKGTLDALRCALSRLGPSLRAAVAIRDVGAAAREALAGETVPGGGPTRDGAHRLQGVSYTYPGTETPALRDVDLIVRPGEVIALVGANGAGKTTLVEMLLGLRMPTSGQANLPPAIPSMVAQQFARYQFALAEAVALDDLAALGARRIESVRARLRQAAPRRFWEDHPDDVALQLGPGWPGGTDLSVGQWQAVAAARCFSVDDADLIVLDEPTAALDPEAQQEMTDRYAALAREVASRGGAAVLITHRMSMPRLADRIVVLDGGRIVEVGTHDELRGAGGLYARAYEAQASGFLQMGGEENSLGTSPTSPLNIRRWVG